MFYFPIWHGTLPDWLPIGGGREFTFFNAIFNFADACITTGVICLLLFFNKDLSTDLSNKDKAEKTDDAGDSGNAGNVDNTANEEK